MLKRGVLLVLILLLLVPSMYSDDEEKLFKVIVLTDDDERSVKKARRIVQNEIKITKQYSKGFAAEVTVQELEELQNDPNIRGVYQDGIRHTFLDVTNPIIGANNATRLILNNSNITGKDQTICVLDTGINSSHPAFGNRIVSQHCYCSLSGGCCVNETSENVYAEDDQGHGSHVIGIAAGNDSTYRGIAPEAKIVSIKVCDNQTSASCGDSDIIAGLEWCTNNASQFNITVISMSLGGGLYSNYCNSDPLAPYINAAVNNNISVVIATGNNNDGTNISAPACVQSAIAVGATTDADTVANTYSNRWALEMVWAPGSNVISVDYEGTTTSKSGTSMSAPHVSGSILLLNQFLQFQNSSVYTPSQIYNVLNSTGKVIENHTRINIYEAILSLDTINPVITINLPENNSYANISVIINISSNEILSSAWIEYNGSNLTMNGAALNWYLNISGNESYTYLVYGNDSSGNVGFSETRIINFTNVAPSIDYILVSSSDLLNRTNGTLTGLFNFSDLNGDTVVNYTYWFNNSVEIISLRNETNFSNIHKNENWTFSVFITDGILTDTENFTITIKNDIPTIDDIDNITVNESRIMNISINYRNDLDNDVVSLSIDNGNFTMVGGSFIWNTTVNDSGSYVFNITLNDSQEFEYKVVYATINDMVDSDNDGLPDYYDSDDDNDGLNDTNDFVFNGSINSTLNISLNINGSSNISQLFNSTFLVNISEDNFTLVEFNWTFNSSNIFYPGNITITKNETSTSWIIIRNLIASKTVYLRRMLNGTGVCIENSDVNSISDISSTCNGVNEAFVLCPGTNNGYNCSFDRNNSYYRISGINNSGITELSSYCGDLVCNGAESCSTCSGDCGVCTTPSTSSGGGGGGGGGGSIAKEINITFEEEIFNYSIYDKPFFIFENESHRFFIDRFDDTIIELSVYSERQIVKIDKGFFKKVDLDNDGVYDLQIKYYGKVKTKASLGLKLIPKIMEVEEIQEEIIEEEVVEEIQETEEPLEDAIQVKVVGKKEYNLFGGFMVLVGFTILSYVIGHKIKEHRHKKHHRHYHRKSKH